MKNSFQIHHLTIFISALLLAVFAIVLHCFAPGDSLLDYALTLEDGQFICETGYIYEAVADYPQTDRIYVRHIGEVRRDFNVSFGSTPSEKLLPHEFAMQMTEYGSIYIDNRGQVWHDTHEEYNNPFHDIKEKRSKNDALLVRYLTPAAEFNTLDAAELNIFGGGLYEEFTRDQLHRQHKVYNYYSLGIEYAIVHTSASSKSYTPASDVEFSVRLRDGWYAITSRNVSTGRLCLPNIGFDTKADARCRITVFDPSADKSLAFEEFDMLIDSHTIHISDDTPQTFQR